MDIPTLFLIIALTNILLAVAMVSMADRPGHAAMGPWSLAALVNAGAYLGFIWHAHAGHPLLLVASNVMVAAWLALVGEGFQRFYQRPLPRWILWVPLPIMLMGLLSLLDNLPGRVILVAILLSCQTVVILFMVLRNRHDTPGRGQVIIVIGLAVLLVLLGIRAIMAGLGSMDRMTSILQANALQVLTFQAGLLAMILLALGVIVMTHERTGQILAASERRFRILFEESRQPLTLMDQAGFFTAANPAALALFHLQQPEQLIGRPLTDFTSPTQPDGRPSIDHARDMRRQTLTLGGHECEWQCLRGDGQPFDALLMLTAIQYEERPLLHVTWNDITRRKAAETQLRINEEKFRTFVEDANDVIYTLNLDGIFQYLSPNIRELLAQEPEDFLGGHFSAIVHPDDLPACQAFLERLLATRSKQSGQEYRVRYGAGAADWRWHVTNASPLFDKDGTIIGMLGIAHDITVRKQDEVRIMHMAHHDGLTALPNRALLFSHLDQAMGRARDVGRMLALMFLDLDKFKPINDTHGHAVGDLVLQQVARRLVSSVREADMVARIGGDEFIVMLPEIRQMEHALMVAENIRQSLQEPFHINGLELSVSTSIGIAFYPEHGGDSRELAQHADIAMYHAKQGGADRVRVYAPDLSAPGA
ncbi:sensor domain-containing diguanylate cyclase [Ectothiorhodospira lacustris]|uniref:sensor domain-containing diguanylate cyclase n=1 Tax=Ectothiorhodospira lacustris TaxID=2899127 RepID=UPI001EE9331D|nr:sensor domain-containing diguanylate cyclase [Ectothiorhodospira lacustris]MCG5499283.1 sensor domain-containing diguanylate cyclase [Ectothiorhodospira lacustris]MCG5509172.1 sensor domain-containing diguanylate cyclase [Ectothiorhodospira lacustris]MCG5520962.1 sensor domain-containing diguanylate cyclase [Ectothiorhodospira lacustris]